MRTHRREDEERAERSQPERRREPAHPLLELQRSAGNQAVTRQLSRVRAKKFTEEETEYQEKLQRFRKFEESGRTYYANMLKAITSQEPEDKNLDQEYDARYATTSAPNQSVPSNATNMVKNPSSYTLVETGVKDKESAYKNYVSGPEHTLVASWNYASNDEGGTGKRLPHSEVLRRQYTEFGGPLKELTTIIRSSIQGAPALELLDMCRGSVGQKFSGITFTPGDDDFYALLASDNCKAIAFMLTDHPVESGRKSITSITRYNDRLQVNLGAL